MKGVVTKLSIVTGGASGIGRAICQSILEAGGKVASVDLNIYEQNTENMRHFSADISLPSEVEKLMEQIRGSFDEIPRGLVNCAGIIKDGWLVDMNEKQWDDVLRVNLKGTHLMSQSFVKMLLASPKEETECLGSIVNIASILGKVGNKYQCNYAASKGGVIAYTKSLAKELGKHQIRVNAILPGFIDTPMTTPFPDKYRAGLVEMIPYGRFGKSEEIADACTYLLSNRASYVTGSAMEVSGGVFM